MLIKGEPVQHLHHIPVGLTFAEQWHGPRRHNSDHNSDVITWEGLSPPRRWEAQHHQGCRSLQSNEPEFRPALATSRQCKLGSHLTSLNLTFICKMGMMISKHRVVLRTLWGVIKCLKHCRHPENHVPLLEWQVLTSKAVKRRSLTGSP